MVVVRVQTKGVEEEILSKVKKELVEAFLSEETTFPNIQLPPLEHVKLAEDDPSKYVTQSKPASHKAASIFFQDYSGISNVVPSDHPMELLHGEPQISETLLGLKFEFQNVLKHFKNFIFREDSGFLQTLSSKPIPKGAKFSTPK